MLRNIKGTYHREPVWGSSTLFFLGPNPYAQSIWSSWSTLSWPLKVKKVQFFGHLYPLLQDVLLDLTVLLLFYSLTLQKEYWHLLALNDSTNSHLQINHQPKLWILSLTSAIVMTAIWNKIFTKFISLKGILEIQKVNVVNLNVCGNRCNRQAVPKMVPKKVPWHTRSFWNITIQWTSHDDLTEKSAENFCIRRF